MSIEDKQFGVKSWSFEYFAGHWTDGWLLIFEEISAIFKQMCAPLLERKQHTNDRDSIGGNETTTPELASARSGSIGTDFKRGSDNDSKCLVKINLEENNGKDSDEQSATLAYGMTIMSKLCASFLLWIAAFVYEARLGLMPSKPFVIIGYGAVILSLVCGFLGLWLVVIPVATFTIPSLHPSTVNFCGIYVIFCELIYIGYGTLNIFFFVYRRKEIYEFILHQCSIITLPRKFQRQQVVRLHLIFVISSLLTVPLFLCIALTTASFYVKNKRTALYAATRPPIIALITFAMSLMNSTTILIPCLTSFIIAATTEHLKNTLTKQLMRFNNVGEFGRPPKGRGASQHNEHLVDFLGDRTSKTIKDYACNTLTMDWPHFVSTNNSPNNCIKSNNLNCDHSTKKEIYSECEDKEDLHTQDHSASYATTSVNLLFLYKNLIRSLIELRVMIRVYEKNFGLYHAVSIFINCLIVSLYVLGGLMEVRLLNDLRGNVKSREAIEVLDQLNKTGSNIDDIDHEWMHYINYKGRLTPFEWRCSIGVASFVISNIFCFIKYNCLPNQMEKMRCQLFKMNIDLACLSIRALHQFSAKESNYERRRSRFRLNEHTLLPGASFVAKSRKLRLRQSMLRTRGYHWIENNDRWRAGRSTGATSRLKHDCCPKEWLELDQGWVLYDHMSRISRQTNFKLAPGIYYSKRCLLDIFGQTVSLSLVSIQVLDLYSFATRH